jgi:hypothetical protein
MLNVCGAADYVTALADAEMRLKDIVQNLFNLMVQSYDHQGPPTQEAIKREVYGLCPLGLSTNVDHTA